ncbi:zinc-binding dehydrogenase [Sphingobium sp. 15-1]|uniref:zinc-binding dehydrogenase n=1 Tax=Sphingobium sp. 15-1 TaxID=2729616 RepID=UPI00159BF3F0|nr:zinc-binding dehydrogenase [Sphingobium sp. 15-1]
MMEDFRTNLVLHSTLRPNGDVELSIDQEDMPPPAEDEIIVRMQAAPVNPTDLFLLCALADPATAQRVERDGATKTVLRAADWAANALSSRWDKPMAVGSEGAGRVVAAGLGKAAQALIGRTVALWGAGSYARYCKVRTADAMLLPDDVSAAEGASAFINPMTVLSMIETMRREGFTALVHTAAASSLGQMLGRLCRKDGIGLVNIVRSPQQVELLRSAGAEHVCDSSSASFDEDLQDAVRVTGARLGFDATGGGTLASRILAVMERVEMEGKGNRQYGSTGKKKIYVYGKLDADPLHLLGNYGLSWGVGGWLVYNFIEEAGKDVAERLKARIATEIKTTFATRYGKTIDLEELCDPAMIAYVSRMTTGGKCLIDMSR